MIRKITACVAFIIIFSTAYSAPKIDAEGAASTDFGKHPAKDQQEALFKIKNSGDADLRIARVIKTCGGCAEISISTMQVSPGQVSEIRLKIISSSLTGPYTKNFFVETNDPEQKFFKFTFTGNAVPLAEIKPSSIIYAGRLEVGKLYQQSFALVPSEKGVEFGEPAVDSNYPVKTVLSKKDNSYFLDFEFTPEKAQGEMRSRIKIPAVKPEGWKPLEIVVSANVGFQLVTVPGRIVLPSAKPDNPVEKDFQLRFAGENKKLEADMLSFENPDGAGFKVVRIDGNVIDLKGTFSPVFIEKLAQKGNIPVVFSIKGAEPATLVLTSE